MVGPAKVFTLFFVTLGPLKALGPFAERTRGLDEADARRIAVRAFLVATVAIVAGGFLGSVLLSKWEVSIAAMTLAGGIIFFLVAIRQLLTQYDSPRAATVEPLPAKTGAAALQLVFPAVLTPYGIAAVIVLLAASGTAERSTTIAALLLLVMTLDLLTMMFARRILVGGVMVILQVLGAVLGVMQVALSLEFVLAGLRSLGAIGG